MTRLAARAAGFAVCAAVMAGAGGASAQQEMHLTIGFSNSITAVDPHFHNVGTNNQVNQHIFDSLIEQDEFQRLGPGLALSWTAVAEDTWELKLRPGVKFHDGSDFDAEDVAATFRRAPNVPNSPSSFAIYTRPVQEVRIIDPLTVHMVTDGPYPLLPNDISNVYIISSEFEGASTDDFNSGAAAVGTGPYVFSQYVPGERVVMTRNDAYWAGAEPWTRVEFRIITQAAARVAALLAGDVDIIDQVPTADIATLQRNQNVRVVSAPSNRVIYFHMDHQDRQTPAVTAKDGSPLPTNPLTDVRVRRALSMAINRQAISERVMEGQSVPAGQFLPEDFFGTSPNLDPMPYDPEGARRLLAEAGYPNGFRMTIHGPNDRYINSPANLQAVAQMFTRIGIDTTVEAIPWATYAPAAGRQEYSFFLVGWGSGTGETSSPLRALVSTFNRDAGLGASNRGRFSNAELDATVQQALRTIDDTERAALLAKASEIAINNFGIIPLHYEVSTWGMRRSLTYVGRSDQYTLAMSVRPAQ